MDSCIDGGSALHGCLPPMLYFLRAAGARASTLIVCIAEQEGVADVVVGGDGGVAAGRRRSSSSLRSLIEIINSMAVPDQVVERDKTIFLHDVAFLERCIHTPTHDTIYHDTKRIIIIREGAPLAFRPRNHAPQHIVALGRGASSTLLGVHTSW